MSGQTNSQAHFDNKEVGDTNSWGGKLDTIPFHVYAMKEPDYVMSLMSTYGTNNSDNGKETRRNWKVGGGGGGGGNQEVAQLSVCSLVVNHRG